MIKHAKAIALNSDLSCAQSFVYPTREYSYGIVVAGKGENVFLEIKQAVLEIENYLFENHDPIAVKLDTIQHMLGTRLQTVNNLSILLSAWQEDVIYVLSQPGFRALLYRGNHLTDLLKDSAGQLVTGHLEIEDRLILTTQNLLKLFAVQDERSIKHLLNIDIEFFQDELTNLVKTNQEIGPVASIVVASEFGQGRNTGFQEIKFGKLKKAEPILKFSLPSFEFGSRIINKLMRQKKLRWVILSIFVLLIVYIGFMIFKPSPKPTLVETPSPVPSVAVQTDPTKISINTFSQLVDLSTLKSGFTTKRFSFISPKAAIYDSGNKNLNLVNFETKNSTILSDSAKLGSVAASSYLGDFVFTYSKEKGIMRFDSSNNKLINVADPDSSLGNISSLFAFGSNIYMLDQGKNQIWKYVPTSNSYSDKSGYFKSDTKVDLSKANILRIDSSIWILGDDGVLQKYTQGKSDSFTISGVDAFKAKNFFVSDNTDNVYLLDAANSRLVVTNKSGAYQKQYLGDKFATVDDLFVDETGKKAYLLIANKIYQILL